MLKKTQVRFNWQVVRLLQSNQENLTLYRFQKAVMQTKFILQRLHIYSSFQPQSLGSCGMLINFNHHHTWTAIITHEDAKRNWERYLWCTPVQTCQMAWWRLFCTDMSAGALFCQLNCKDSCCLPLSTLVLLSILLCVVIPIGLFKLFPSLDVCLLPIKSHTKKKNMRSWSSGLSSKCMWKAASTWPRWWWSSNSAKLSLESSARPWKPLNKWSPDRTYMGHSD